MRILKPGGVMLAAVPCAAPFRGGDPDGAESSRFSEGGWRRLLSPVVPSTHVATRSFGNLLASIAMFAGLARQQLSPEELETNDSDYPLVVGIRAVKPMAAPAVLNRRPKGSGAILLYHRVTEPSFDVHGLCVKPADFRTHLTYLTRHCRLMPLVQLAAAVREGWLPERAVAITFDDGYLDNLLQASPILLEYQSPATFFMTNTGLRGADPFWWDVLAAIFLGPNQIPPSIHLELGEAEESLATATDLERRHAHDRIYLHLRTADAAERARVLGVVQRWSGLSLDLAPGRAMNRNELADLARRPGHSIGSQGADHLWLSSHARDVIQRDIRDNRLLLEGAIGGPVSCFAYPFGDHDNRSVEVVRDLGFAAAVTCVEGGVRPGMDPLRLPRLVVGSADGSVLDDRLRNTFAAVSEAQVSL
jgi:peptidoglycan/xylan/chitin deacetylase (PgdA/CDA1 family)